MRIKYMKYINLWKTSVGKEYNGTNTYLQKVKDKK